MCRSPRVIGGGHKRRLGSVRRKSPRGGAPVEGLGDDVRGMGGTQGGHGDAG